MAIQDVLSKLGPAVQAVSRIIEDPYLPELSCQVMRLNRIAKRELPGPPCARTVLTSKDAGKGIGLKTASAPLRGFVWLRQNPLIAGAIGVALVGGIYYLGYRKGRRRSA